MKGLRILNKLPSFYEIYQYFPRTDATKYVFEDTYLFKDDKCPPENDLEMLDDNQQRLGSLLVLNSELIDKFGPNFSTSSNCIHVYQNLRHINCEIITFKNLNWNWTYYCHDDTLVEIFIKVGYEEVYKALKYTYDCLENEFPGSISSPGGMNILT